MGNDKFGKEGEGEILTAHAAVIIQRTVRYAMLGDHRLLKLRMACYRRHPASRHPVHAGVAGAQQQ